MLLERFVQPDMHCQLHEELRAHMTVVLVCVLTWYNMRAGMLLSQWEHVISSNTLVP